MKIRFRTTVYLLLAVLALLGTTAGAQEPTPEGTGASPLALLIGDWRAVTHIPLPNGKDMTGAANFSVRPILDGRGVQINEHQDPAVAGRPPYSETVILTAESDGTKAKGASLNSLGNQKILSGEYRDGELVLIQTGEMYGGRPGKNRLTWFDIEAGSFSFRLDSYTQATDDWKLGVYSYSAIRVVN